MPRSTTTAAATFDGVVALESLTLVLLVDDDDDDDDDGVVVVVAAVSSRVVSVDASSRSRSRCFATAFAFIALRNLSIVYIYFKKNTIRQESTRSKTSKKMNLREGGSLLTLASAAAAFASGVPSFCRTEL